MPNARRALAIFCDDIRNEVGNKFSFMGLYSTDLTFPAETTLPTNYPKLGIVAWLLCDVGDAPEKMTVTVTGPDDSEWLKTDIEIDPPPPPPEGAADMRLQTVMALSPAPITKEGYVTVMIDTGREKIRAGRLMIRVAKPAD